MNKNKIYVGIFLIIIGLLFLVQNMGYNLPFKFLWPIVLLIPGLMFYISFYQKKEAKSSSLLIPGTILILYSLYFFLNQINDYKYAAETSFVFTLAISLGFFMAYYYDHNQSKRKGYIIPGWILLGVSVISFLSNTTQLEWWPIILIAIGVYLLYKKENKPAPDKTDK